MTNLNFDNIDLECEKTWDLIGSGNTKGVFQLESRLGQSMAKKLRPENIEQLSALISIMRPGCISGDTKIFVDQYKHIDGNIRFRKVKIRDIANKPNNFSHILSYNESTGRFINNTMVNAFYTGHKECFKVILKSNEKETTDFGKKQYKLECTNDHKLLTPQGWKSLKDIEIGDRILAHKRNGTKLFRQRCYNTYIKKCILCDWNKGSLDLNHITGNRFNNNDTDNLCYMRPNHYREFTEGSISIQEIITAREKYKLPETIDCEWCTLEDKIEVGIQDVYDITMLAPHHNFIAGGIVVHNCLEAIRDGKSVSNHYIDKKNAAESIDYFHPALEQVLRNTYGEMVYQEQAMEITRVVAGFDLSEADMLRKAIGKKKPEEMAKIKTLFMEKSKERKIVNEKEADEIFGWIEKSQRYSFNKSHAISYAINAYVSAYAKTHFKNEFFVSYLRFAKDKIDPMKEVYELVNNAIENGITIYRPDLRKLNSDFILDNNIIYFGLTNIKGIGISVFNKIMEYTKNIDLNNISINILLFMILDKINSTAAKGLVSVGGVDYMKISRKKILFYLDIIDNLSTREKDLIVSKLDIELPLSELLSRLIPLVNQKRKDVINSLILAINKPAYSLEDNYEWIASMEKQYLGVPITCSIVDGRDLEAANTDCRSLNKCSIFSKSIIIGAEIDDINIVKTKKGKNPGQEMAFIKISDGTGSCDIVVFPKEFASNKSVLYKDNTVMFSLEQSKKKDSYIVKKCWQI